MNSDWIFILFIFLALSLCLFIPLISDDEFREMVYESRPVQWFIKVWNQFWK